MSKATFGEPLLHAIGNAYKLAAEKELGADSFLGIDSAIAGMKQKSRQYGAYAEVARKGYNSINAMKQMAEIAEEEKRKVGGSSAFQAVHTNVYLC